MKKLFLTLALAAFAMTANAQWILGGQFGYNTTGGNVSVEATAVTPAYDYPNNKVSNFTFAPTVSYVLNEKMQVGLTFSYTLFSNTNYTPMAYAANYEAYNKFRTSTLGIAPYFRYYFAEAGNFKFFCEAQLGIYSTPRTYNYTYSTVPPADNGTETEGAFKTSTLAFTITPGVNYKINDKWSADCYVDLAGLAFTRNTTKTYAGDNLVDTDVTNYFGLMADASAQTLNAHFGNFRIGFNYHF